MRLIHTKIRVCNKYTAKGRMLEAYMEGNKNNFDISILTREYSSGKELLKGGKRWNSK